MRRVIGIDIHRTFGEGVIEATGNYMAVSRVLTPYVRAIAHAHVKTDKVDAATLASLYAVGY